MALESIVLPCDPDDPLCGISGPEPGDKDIPEWDPTGAVAAGATRDPMMMAALGLIGGALPFGPTQAMIADANLTAAEKGRLGALPPQEALPAPDRMQPLTLGQTIDTAMGPWGGTQYEDAVTGKDLQTMAAYGLHGDLGTVTGGFQTTDPLGTDYGYGRSKQTAAGPRTHLQQFSWHPEPRRGPTPEFPDLGEYDIRPGWAGLSNRQRAALYPDLVQTHIQSEVDRERMLAQMATLQSQFDSRELEQQIQQNPAAFAWDEQQRAASYNAARNAQAVSLKAEAARDVAARASLAQRAEQINAAMAAQAARDAAAAKAAAQEFAAWDPGGDGGGGDPGGGDAGFGGEDSPW
jgi:hypothetical protein